MLFPQTSQIMYLTILAHLIKQSSLQSIIYSITRINSSQDIETDEAIITTAITSSTFRPLSQNASSTTTVDKQAKIYVRSKRHNMQKMPRLPKLDPNESTENGELKDRQNISLVLAQLLNHYDHNQRPGYGGPPASITTNLEIRSMGPISELDMEYSLDCYFRQKWEDERLRFKGNTTYLSLNIKMLDKIWKPDTYFHTGKGSHLHMITTPNKFLRIFQNGLVLYSMRLTIKSLCPMDLHSFPMDKQSCPLILGSYGYPNDQLVYSWDKKPVTFNKKDFTLSQFDIVKTIYRNGTFIFKRGNHSMLQVNFNLRRHVGYFLIQIYVPCSLIVVLSWVSFWINREATADRVGLGVTSVLTLSTFGLDSRSDLPRVSYATALDWFTIMCFLFVVFTLLQFAGVHYFTKVGTGEVPMIEIDDEESTSGSNACSDEEDGIEEQSHRNRTFSDSRRYYNWNQQQSKVRRRKLKPKGNQLMRGKMMKGKIKQHKANSVQFPSEYEMQYSYNSCNQLYPDNQQFIQNDFEYNLKVEDDPNRCNLIGNHMPKAISNSDNYDSFHMPYCPKNPAYQEYLRLTELNKDNVNFESSNVDLDFSRMSYLENYLNKRLKQSSRNLVYPMNNRNYNHNTSQAYNDAAKLNSSWPTLAWKNLPDNCKNNRQTIGEIENYVDDCIEVGDCYQRPDDNETDDDQSVQDNSWINVWKSIIYPMSHCCLEFWYCFTVNEEYKQEMRRRRTPNVSGMSAVNSVSKIDKVSRILFPLVFFILNISYWIFYINERNAEFNQWESGIIIY